MTAPITVLIADDHGPVREGLKILLEFEPDLQVIGEAQDGLEAIELCRLFHPDVVVMDITMPRLNGLEATRLLREEMPRTQILIISAADDDVGVEQALACGAVGFLCKHTSLMNVPRALRAIHAGHTFFALTPRAAR